MSPSISWPMRQLDGVPHSAAGTVSALRAALRSSFGTPDRQVVALIIGSLLLRTAFAGVLGLGVDESYMVAAGRTLAFGYFDHPPISWWIVWGTTHLLQSESELVVRLPFILLFGITTWLMYRVASRAFGPRAGLWCAVALNLSPMFGVTTGSWVLPDGPLMAALAGMSLCFLTALEADGRRAWTFWTATGLCAGLAMLSKYSAAMPMAGALGYLLTSSRHRSWLRRPEPYVAGLVALLAFSPAVLWNMQHHWASFAFQGARATGSRFRPLAPLTVLSGETLFLLPWIGIPLFAVLVRSVWRGPQDWRGWMFAWLAAPAIVFFPAVAIWSSGHVLFHWAAPGFLMLFPVLGMELARLRQVSGGILPGLAVGTAILLVMCAAAVGSEVRWNWLPEVGEDFAVGSDPDMQAVDWTSLRLEIGQLARQHPGLVVAATRWHECGKLDYALGHQAPFLCLATDAREFGETEHRMSYAGRDILIAAPRSSLRAVTASLGPDFEGIEQLPPATLLHAGRPAMEIPLFLGHRFEGR